MKEQINNNFKYHAPKGNQVEKYYTLRREARALAHLIDDLCPNSREKSLAITKLEEAIMWSNASIARNETKEQADIFTIGEFKREIVFSSTKHGAECKLQEIVENLDDGEILLEKKKDYIKTDKRDVRAVSVNSYTTRELRCSTAYVDEAISTQILHEVIKPILTPLKGKIEYFK